MARRASSKGLDSKGDKHHSGKTTVKQGKHSSYVSVESDNHDEPGTGSREIYYPSSGTSLPGGT